MIIWQYFCMVYPKIDPAPNMRFEDQRHPLPARTHKQYLFKNVMLKLQLNILSIIQSKNKFT